ncbi:FOLD4 [Symbiodinium sp. KB8]|nr:FOLD4 [Symbiodinium sp. KB8]
MAKVGKAPGLAVILVGARPDSATYVRMKRKACEEVGIADFGVNLPVEASEDEIVAAVRAANEDERVHGILVQLPLPEHVNEMRVLSEISPEKDVDGLHPANVGDLALRGRNPRFVACTPRGCIELLHRNGIEISGKSAVVLGRSNIVGIPAALLLLQENATVTVCHSRTKDIEARIRDADILVAAIGKAHFVQGSWIKPGAVVIDVGINSVDDATKKRGYRLVGDVDYAAAKPVASAITPVPGGVGPMTIAMLLQNTVEAGERALTA